MLEWLTLDFLKEDFSKVDILLQMIRYLMELIGSLIIFVGSFSVICQFVYHLLRSHHDHMLHFDRVRLNLARTIALGLEFIVAGDVIQTTTTPDYYTVGLLASIVAIRTVLNYSISKEIQKLTTEEQQRGKVSI